MLRSFGAASLDGIAWSRVRFPRGHRRFVDVGALFSAEMPEISRFLGIVIGMFFSEHGLPHFHAVYGEYKNIVEIDSGRVRGDFPAAGYFADTDTLYIEFRGR